MIIGKLTIYHGVLKYWKSNFKSYPTKNYNELFGDKENLPVLVEVQRAELDELKFIWYFFGTLF